MSKQAIATETIVRPKQQPPKPKRQPQYGVMVYNDDDHTFAYVIEVFQKVFGYNRDKCAKLALEIHTRGCCVVWAGWRETAELKVELIKSAGKDHYSVNGPITYPLDCRAELLPG